MAAFALRAGGQLGTLPRTPNSRRTCVAVCAGKFDEELVNTAVSARRLSAGSLACCE